MQTSDDRKNRKQRLKHGRKILGYALEGFYAFEDDEIEDLLEKAVLKFEGQRSPPIRSWIMSHQKIMEKICQVGSDIYGS